MDHFKDAHYFHIPSQGNLYTMTDLKLANGNTLILFASLKREIFYFEYLEESQGGLVPTTKEVSFTYIPTGAEIISIDAFNKSVVKNELVIGITIIKNSTESDTLECFLNIYSQLEDHEDFNIEDIAHDCLTLKLSYIPYKLMHTYLFTWEDDKIVNKEIVFILSGSDNQVHLYKENTNDHVYKEVEIKDRFPEFGKTPSPVLWIDIFHINNYEERVTAIGCECGYVKVLKTNTKTNKLVYNFSTRFGNLISKVHLYLEKNIKSVDVVAKLSNKPSLIEKKESRPILNLVVVNSVLPSVLFQNILKYGLSDYITLPRHDYGSNFGTCTVADVDFDNQKEILIGTSSEELLLFKQDINDNKWYLEEIKYFSSPILAMKYLDLTGDGVKELVIFSMKGIHLLQHDPLFIKKQLASRVDMLTIPKIPVSSPISTKKN